MDTSASFNENDETIECLKSNIKLKVDMITFGKGTLYVTESKLYWKNNANGQVISINYDVICKYYVSHYPKVHKKPCLKMIVDFNYKPGNNKIYQNKVEEKEKFKSIIKLVPDNPECLNEIFEAIACIQPLHFSDYVDEESESDEHEESDKKSNTTITPTCTQEDQKAGSIDISNQYHKLDEKNGEKEDQVNSIKCLDNPHSPIDSLNDNTTITPTCTQEDQKAGSIDISNQYHKLDEKNGEKEDQVNSIKCLDIPHSPIDSLNDDTTITPTCTQEDQKAGSIDISNQCHKLDEKNDEKENQVNSIKCLDIPHSPSDSLNDNEYSDDSENDDLELNNTKSLTSYIKISARAPLHSDVDLDTSSEDDIFLQDEEVLTRSPISYLRISSRAPLRSDVDLDTSFEDDILLQDKEVLINERKRKFKDLSDQEEKPTKIRKLWNFMKYPFQKITSFNTSISENESNIPIDEVMTEAIAGKKNSLKPETAVCENISDTVKPEEKNSKNNSEADGENEDTSTNKTSQNFCKLM